MSSIVRYSQCPACASPLIAPVMQVKDHSVSQELFEVWECPACTLRFTQAVPDNDAIGPYYKSSNYISHTNTKAGLVNRLYHIVRNRTLQSKRRLVESVTGKTGGSLLDVGAGTGAFLSVMQEAGWQVKGLEPDMDARAVAQADFKVSLSPLGEFFALPDQSFDAITLWHVLEHVHALHPYLEKLHRLLKPGGKLLIAVPNYTAADARHYAANWAAYDVPRHLYHFSPVAMRQLLQSHQLTVESTRPMWFDSFYVSMLSEQYKRGHGNLIAAFWQGAWSNLKALRHKEKCSSVIYVVGGA